MEKTIQISIGGTQFQLTDSAYSSLSAYLERLKAQFDANDDGPEIIGDIESRIAEKLLETKHTLITTDDIATVISDMGDAEAFGESGDTDTSRADTTTPVGKKLYRNIDDAVIAGVASGIAAYFGVSVVAVRLAFLFTTLFSGASVAIYIILWIIMPAARTASQKLEMKGAAVTLESIARVVKDRVDETRERGVFQRILRFPAEVVSAFSSTIFPLISKVLGFFLSLGAFFSFIGVSIVLGIVLFNWNASWNDIPHKEFISPVVLKSLLAVGYTAIVIPLLFIFALGQRWLKNRALISSTVGFGLMGVWALSLVGCGVLGTKLVGDYVSFTQSSPEYAQTIQNKTITAFDSLSVRNVHVTIRSGSAYNLQFAGRVVDLPGVTYTEKDGVLTIESVPRNGPCLFCSYRTPSVIVTVPSMSALSANNASIELDKLSLPSLVIDAQNANINGTLNSASTTILLRSSWSGITVTGTSLSANLKNSRLVLDGSVTTASFSVRDASIEADTMRIDHAEVSAVHSTIRTDAKSIRVLYDDASDVQNAGTEAGVSDTETNG